MKHTLIILLLLFIAGAGYAQTSDYPRFYTDSAGNRCVVFTLAQAQKVDNDMELLKMYRVLDTSAEKAIKSWKAAVAAGDKNIADLNFKVTDLMRIGVLQDENVRTLHQEIVRYRASDSLANRQLADEKKVSKNLKKAIGKQKKLKWLGFGAGAVGIIVAILIAL